MLQHGIHRIAKIATSADLLANGCRPGILKVFQADSFQKNTFLDVQKSPIGRLSKKLTFPTSVGKIRLFGLLADNGEMDTLISHPGTFLASQKLKKDLISKFKIVHLKQVRIFTSIN